MSHGAPNNEREKVWVQSAGVHARVRVCVTDLIRSHTRTAVALRRRKHLLSTPSPQEVSKQPKHIHALQALISN